jgi:probable rRNA maturation factor
MPKNLDLTIQYAVPKKGLPRRKVLRQWAEAALAGSATATLRWVDEAEGRELNRDFRKKDYATNVLTFVYGDDPLEGDIVLCAPVVEREAAEQGKSFEAHVAHLVVHGMLHLQGYDHEKQKDALVMEALEGFIMRRLGFSSPYNG